MPISRASSIGLSEQEQLSIELFNAASAPAAIGAATAFLLHQASVNPVAMRAVLTSQLTRGSVVAGPKAPRIIDVLVELTR